MPESEVAKMRERIARERQAFKDALYGLVQVKGHEALRVRYAILDEHYEHLASLVGDREAWHIYTAEYAHLIEQTGTRS